MLSSFKCDFCGYHPKCKQEQLDQPLPQHWLRHHRGFHHIFSKRRLILNKYMSKSIIFIIKTHDYIGLYKHFAQIFATIVTNVDLLNTWSEIENSHEKYAWDFNRSDTWTNSCKCVYAAKHILTKRYETISVQKSLKIWVRQR